MDGALSCSCVIPVGARNITNDLAIGLRISLESAEKIKIALSKKHKTPALPEELMGTKGKKEETNKDELDFSELDLPEGLKKVSKRTLIDGIIRPRLTEIFTLVGIELQNSGFGGQTPAGVVITGGGAETNGVVEACRQRLSLPVRLGYSTGVTGLIDELQSLPSSTAVGLLLYGAQNEEGGTKWSVPRFSSFGSKIPVKGIAKKLIDLIKSFLP